jgi:hypothetical protein
VNRHSVAAAQGFFDSLARGLVAHAARRAPLALTERLEEEWFAAREERCGTLARLGLALGCWATGVIARERAGIRLRAVTAPADAKLSADVPHQEAETTVDLTLELPCKW